MSDPFEDFPRPWCVVGPDLSCFETDFSLTPPHWDVYMTQARCANGVGATSYAFTRVPRGDPAPTEPHPMIVALVSAVNAWKETDS